MPTARACSGGGAEPGASLTGELEIAVTQIRRLVGEDAWPTISLDRGGYSPKLFAELKAARAHLLTYRKAPLTDEPRGAFAVYELKDDLGRAVPNPETKKAASAVRAAKAAVTAAEAELARPTLETGSAGLEGIDKARDALVDAKAAQRAVPARVALGEV
jgi:hypothetical protein